MHMLLQDIVNCVVPLHLEFCIVTCTCVMTHSSQELYLTTCTCMNTVYVLFVASAINQNCLIIACIMHIYLCTQG